jgi:uncharacterized protein YecE (DUF72 family)
MSWVRNPLAAPNISKVSIRGQTLPRIPQAPLFAVPGLPPATPPHLFAGTSGWAYPTWKPAFYPARTPAKKFLEFYGTQLTSVEVNYTFRTLPSAKILEDWLAATPANFRFSFKAPQRITHIRRLRDSHADVAQFVAALEPVRQAEKLGLLLFQLPPNFKADKELLTNFLSAPALRTSYAPPIAFEFRHESWFSEEIYDVLREHDAALCIAESDDLRTPEVHTAGGHTCFRLRRNRGYTPEELDEFASRFLALAQQRDVYAYFKHEDEPTGALNATAFLASAVSKAGTP